MKLKGKKSNKSIHDYFILLLHVVTLC